MRIKRLIWPEDRIDHIAHHNVIPEDVEDVCFGNPFVQRGKITGSEPALLCFGANICRFISFLCYH